MFAILGVCQRLLDSEKKEEVLRGSRLLAQRPSG